MKNNQIILPAIVALLIGGGVGFFGGMQYQKSQQPKNNFAAFQQSGMPGQGYARQGGMGIGEQGGANMMRGNRTGARQVMGEIISQDDKSITVKLQDGSSKIVLLSDTTSLNKSSEAGKSDLKTGTTVAVFGKENTDGSVTAQSIQLNPLFRGITGTPGANQPAK